MRGGEWLAAAQLYLAISGLTKFANEAVAPSVTFQVREQTYSLAG
ncbi:hypothetical protein [Cystobacter fuscus]